MEPRWINRLTNFQRALRQLENGLQTYPNLTDLEQDGVLQRFGFTVELAWKTLQAYFADVEGYTDVKGPRKVIIQAFKNELVANGHDWLQLLDSRKALSDVVDQAERHQILVRVQDTYLALLQDLNRSMSTKNDQP